MVHGITIREGIVRQARDKLQELEPHIREVFKIDKGDSKLRLF